MYVCGECDYKCDSFNIYKEHKHDKHKLDIDDIIDEKQEVTLIRIILNRKQYLLERQN